MTVLLGCNGDSTLAVILAAVPFGTAFLRPSPGYSSGCGAGASGIFFSLASSSKAECSEAVISLFFSNVSSNSSSSVKFLVTQPCRIIASIAVYDVELFILVRPSGRPGTVGLTFVSCLVSARAQTQDISPRAELTDNLVDEKSDPALGSITSLIAVLTLSSIVTSANSGTHVT